MPSPERRTGSHARQRAENGGFTMLDLALARIAAECAGLDVDFAIDTDAIDRMMAEDVSDAIERIAAECDGLTVDFGSES